MTAPGARSVRARVRLTITLTGVLLTAFDLCAVGLALPEITAGLGVDPADLHRGVALVTAFAVAAFLTIPLARRLSTVWGPRRVLLLALGGYAAGAALAAVAASLGPMVLARATQGAAAGAMLPAALAMVDAWWSPGHRESPRRLVDLVQEAVVPIGPLVAAGVLATTSWRALFWAEFALALGLAWVLVRNDDPRERRTRLRLDRTGLGLAVGAVVLGTLVAARPGGLVSSAFLGGPYERLVEDVPGTSPIGLAVLAAVGVLVARDLRTPGDLRPVLALHRLRSLHRRVDLPGAGLAATAGGLLVAAPATADPDVHPLAGPAGPLLAGAAVAAGAAAMRARARGVVLRPPAGRGPVLAGSALLGAVLITLVVYVPVFNGTTGDGYSVTGAAVVLLRLLLGLAVGSVAGAVLAARVGPRLPAAAGLGLTALALCPPVIWSAAAPGRGASWPVLVLAGLGLGLAAHPLTRPGRARLAPRPDLLAAVAAARMAGIAIGLAVLTSVGLMAYHARLAGVLPPEDLCPTAPGQCAVYELQVRLAVVEAMQAVFVGAAVCAAVAAVVCVVALPGRSARRPAPRAG